jgi:hypothetical protein
MAIAAGHAAWPAVTKVKGHVKTLRTFTVRVSSEDDVYDDLHEWVLSLLPPAKQRALVAWSSRSRQVIMSGDVMTEANRLRLRYDGSREQAVRVGGYRIRVQVAESEAAHDGRWTPPEIVFTASSPPGRDALLAEIARILEQATRVRKRPTFRILDKWGDWSRLDDLPARPLESVILPPGQLDRITADIRRFLGSEEAYLHRGIPWHRGHLYEGEPGTGKSSTALAVAGHFGMDIWYLPLADVNKDSDLIRTVTYVSPRSMLLLEDADVFQAATQRKEGKKDRTVTLSGLLNSLDGIATPHGLLTVLTTNRLKALDEAVIREGRADLRENFALAGEDQVRRLIGHWYGEPWEGPVTWGMSPAAVNEACKRQDTPGAAAADLEDRYGGIRPE